MSKSTDKSDLVRPMPGNITPMWELATQQQMANGAIATTVPIITEREYTAQFPCAASHSHEGHTHPAAKVVTQKLAILIGGDSSACYVINIVPFDECSLSAEAISEGFKYDIGMSGFTGFAAYHNFNGSLAYIDTFENGAT